MVVWTDLCVPYRIVPARLVLSVVREQLHDKFVDLREREHLARGTVYGHVDHGYVARDGNPD